MLFTRLYQGFSITRTAGASIGSKRFKSVVFDIDGVLLKGKNPIPQAPQALKLLDQANIPFIFLTNGGGLKESERVKFLSEALDYPLKLEQLIQSHTPMRDLTLKHNKVLVVGGEGDKSRACAEDYGFQKVIMPVDLVAKFEHIAPHHRFSEQSLQELGKPVPLDQDIDAILVFNDPRDMATDLQIIMDYLNSEKGVYGTKKTHSSSEPAVPIYFSNNDFYWSNEFHLPRFGQGVFRIIIETIYKQTNDGKDLVRQIYGKPFKIQYDYCELTLNDSDVYMIGDNPYSDIQGANSHGWNSCLLNTGVYKPGDHLSPEITPSHGIHENVLEAIQHVIRQ